MPGFSVAISAVVAWISSTHRHVGVRWLTFIACIGAVAVVVGWGGQPAAMVGTLCLATATGMVVGKALPRTAVAMATLLAVAAVLDLAWMSAGGGVTGEIAQRIGTLSIEISGRESSMGTVDLCLAAAVATHSMGRGHPRWVAVPAAPLGLAVANVYALASGETNFAIVPFILLGWLATETLARTVQERRGQGLVF